MPEVRPSRRLDQPRNTRRLSLDIDPEAFGRFSERLARLLGTGKFLFWQTLLVAIWISLNVFAGANGLWDAYPFILLNLAFSTQAAYAAPLILLAQNRQDDRDRISLEEDRMRAAQTKADTEYLARELAALRIALGEIATRDYLRGELDRLRADLDDAGPSDETAAAKKRKGSKERRPTPPKDPVARRDRPGAKDAGTTKGAGPTKEGAATKDGGAPTTGRSTADTVPPGKVPAPDGTVDGAS